MTEEAAARTGTRSRGRAPESASKPEAPTKLTKRSWKYVLRKTVREFIDDQCPDMAAALTYFGVLSLFPGAIAVFSLLGLLGQNQVVADALIGMAEDIAPEGSTDALRGPIEQAASAPGTGFALIIGIAIALWSSSRYLAGFTRALNRIYEIDEGRPIWKLKPYQLLLTLIAVVLICIAALLLVVSGPVAEAIGGALGLGEVALTVWQIAKWPVLLVIVILILAILYYAAPNVKQPKFRWISPGAMVAIVILAIATLAFGLYIANFSNYDRTYGSLAGVIIFLLWLWMANLAVLLGAEFDAELERGRQLQGGIVAEEDIQLPPRDDQKIEKTEKTERKEEEEGRRIRLEHGDHPERRRRGDRGGTED